MKIGVPISNEIFVIGSQKTLHQNNNSVIIAVAETVAIDRSQRSPMGCLQNRCDRSMATVFLSITTVLQPSP